MIMKKIVLALFVFASVVTISTVSTSKAEAAPVFPAGCSSAIGYSVTNGTPCNGTLSSPILSIQGCASPLGYSTVNGIACSGVSEAISYLGGCSSVYGYSTATGSPCNGTAVASMYYYPIPDTTPGLPTTGTGGLTLANTLLLLALGLVSVGSIVYNVRYANKA